MNKYKYIVVLIFAFLSQKSTFSQVYVVNDRHLDNNTLTKYRGVKVLNNNNFIVSGFSLDSTENYSLGMLKSFDYDIDERWRISLEDTNFIHGYFDWSNIVTVDKNENYVLRKKNNYYELMHFNDIGDTISTHEIKDLWVSDSVYSAYTGELIFSVKDSMFYSNVNVVLPNQKLSSCFIKFDKYGDLKKWKYIQPYGIFNKVLNGAISQLNDSTFAVGITEVSDDGYIKDRILRNCIVYMDTSGNEFYRWTDSENQFGNVARKIFPMADGGLIFIRIQGEYMEESNGIKYKGSMVKLNAEFQFQWESKFGYRHAGVNVEDAIMLADSSIVVVGMQPAQIDENPYNQIYGWMVKLDKKGTVLWERRFYNVSHIEDPLNNNNKLYGIDQLSNGGFIMVGETIKGTNLMNNLPGFFGWLIVTDENGCLIPGCEDSNPDKNAQSVGVIYPNPAKDVFHVYYDSDSKSVLKIFDEKGKLIKKFELDKGSSTYIISVTHLSSGVYSVVIESGGRVVVKEKLVKE